MPKSEFDKYRYYAIAVQSPEADIETFEDIFRENRKRKPVSLREDFCGTFLICYEWIKSGRDRTAVGVDLDPQPIAYGFSHHAATLTAEQRSRLQIVNGNVLDRQRIKVDITVAVNFSYFTFKSREILKRYFAAALKGLNRDGMLLLDCFGGSACYEPNQEVTKFKRQGFDYIWDQVSFDPIANRAEFEIHFKLRGQKVRRKCFQYDWRMWSIPELRELLLEAGFKKTIVYWEGTTRSGSGDGKFIASEVGEDCESWIAYVCALK